MIGATVLNRSKPKTLLLVHGLFTSSGFWLPYLSGLKDFRLLILDIDYRAVGEIAPYLAQVAAIVEAQAGGQVEAMLSHSLGAVLASQLPPGASRASYEICPVYGATRLQQDDFIGEIGRRTGLDADAIRAQLAEADRAIAAHGARAAATTATVYLPQADPYFAYRAHAASQTFRGDHFDIAAAVTDIGRKLAA